MHKESGNNRSKSKISKVFAERLLKLKPTQKVRAIVMLRTKPDEISPPSRKNRQEKIKAIQKGSEAALTDLEQILKKYEGAKLTPLPDALGSIPVETTSTGIFAIADSEHVSAILEDQGISLL